MADHFLGNIPVLRGNLDLCRAGAWTAEVVLQTDTAPDEGTTTTLSIAGTSRLCTVMSTSSDYLQVKCRLVAGRGKLGAEIEARDYRGYQAAQIAQDALQDAGETSGTWDALNAYCPHWTRRQGPCRDTMWRLLRLLGRGNAAATSPRWRVLDDGTVDTVVDDFAVVAEELRNFEAMASWGQERLLLLGVEDTIVVPGKSVVAFGASRQLDRVIYVMEPESFTAYCWYL